MMVLRFRNWYIVYLVEFLVFIDVVVVHNSGDAQGH